MEKSTKKRQTFIGVRIAKRNLWVPDWLDAWVISAAEREQKSVNLKYNEFIKAGYHRAMEGIE